MKKDYTQLRKKQRLSREKRNRRKDDAEELMILNEQMKSMN